MPGELRWRHACHDDFVGADEGRERAQGRRGAGQSRLAVEGAPRGGGRRRSGREPALEVHAAHLEPPRLAMNLRVEPADELPVMEDRQAVIPMHALVARCIDLDPIVETEQAPRALAVPQERIEG
jgi:hypothetical protein